MCTSKYNCPVLLSHHSLTRSNVNGLRAGKTPPSKARLTRLCSWSEMSCKMFSLKAAKLSCLGPPYSWRPQANLIWRSLRNIFCPVIMMHPWLFCQNALFLWWFILWVWIIELAWLFSVEVQFLHCHILYKSSSQDLGFKKQLNPESSKWLWVSLFSGPRSSMKGGGVRVGPSRPKKALCSRIMAWNTCID